MRERTSNVEEIICSLDCIRRNMKNKHIYFFVYKYLNYTWEFPKFFLNQYQNLKSKVDSIFIKGQNLFSAVLL